MRFLRKYGEATTITFGLRDTDGVLLKSDAVFAAGDVNISKDEGADNPITVGFADEGFSVFSLGSLFISFAFSFPFLNILA